MRLPKPPLTVQYLGSEVSSPAISNLGTTLARVAYGIAIPTIIIAGVINASVAAKLTMHRSASPSRVWADQQSTIARGYPRST